MKENNYKTEEEIMLIISGYKNMDAFRVDHPEAYNQAKDLGLLPKLEKMMNEQKPYTQMEDREIIELAKQYKTRNELEEFAPSVLAQIYKRSLSIPAFAHFEKEKTKTKATDEEILEVAKRYKKLHDFMLQDKSFYNIAHKRGLIPKIKTFLEIRKDVGQLSNEELIAIARGFKSRDELHEFESGVHKEIYKREIGEKAFSHMAVSKNANYTDEELLLEMAKYKSQKEFMTQDSKRFYSAKRKGLLKGYYK